LRRMTLTELYLPQCAIGLRKNGRRIQNTLLGCLVPHQHPSLDVFSDAPRIEERRWHVFVTYDVSTLKAVALVVLWNDIFPTDCFLAWS
ncbi:hypothetical protein KEM54_004510, partial [Ascosphaera aggregata]